MIFVSMLTVHVMTGHRKWRPAAHCSGCHSAYLAFAHDTATHAVLVLADRLYLHQQGFVCAAMCLLTTDTCQNSYQIVDTGTDAEGHVLPQGPLLDCTT